MRLITALNRPVDCDVEQRVLRGAIIATTALASDGMILLPAGLELRRWLRNAVILDNHQNAPGKDANAPLPNVIGNAENVDTGDLEIAATIRFADTARGREFASLYGCNADKKTYMRGWSIEAPVIERQTVDWPTARKLAAQYWDETLAERMKKRGLRAVQVGLRSELAAVAAVPYGADRDALTRAAKDGLAVAGELVARMDLDEAAEALRSAGSVGSDRSFLELNERITRLEQEIQALRGEGASAAARGDSEAVLAEVRELLKIVRQLPGKR